MRRLLRQSGFAWVSGLASAAATRPAVDDDRFTDEEILTVVRAGEGGMKLADLCEATGIPVSTYYRWKARYGGLTPQQLRSGRQRARQRKRRLTLVACAVGVATAAVGGLMMTRQTDAAPFVAAVARTARPPAVGPTSATANVAAATAVAATPPAPAAPAAPPAGITVPSTAPAATPEAAVAADPTGYSVQIAALPDLLQARTALEQLAAAGYPAHITTRTVNGVEMYRVRVGPLATRALAELTATRLRGDGYGAPWVTR